MCPISPDPNPTKSLLVGEYLKNYPGTVPVIGLRINPVVGAGNIAMISTATPQSKFGLPLTKDTCERILSLYQNNPWLTAVHIHVGSQGVPLTKFVDGKIIKMYISYINTVSI